MDRLIMVASIKENATYPSRFHSPSDPLSPQQLNNNIQQELVRPRLFLREQNSRRYDVSRNCLSSIFYKTKICKRKQSVYFDESLVLLVSKTTLVPSCSSRVSTIPLQYFTLEFYPPLLCSPSFSRFQSLSSENH